MFCGSVAAVFFLSWVFKPGTSDPLEEMPALAPQPNQGSLGVNPLVSGSWKSLGSQQVLGVVVSITYFNNQQNWTCVCVCVCTQSSQRKTQAFLRGHSSVWRDPWALDFQENRQRGTELAGNQWENNYPQETMMKPGCGFALLTKWLFTRPVSSVSSCVYRELR